MMTRRASVFCKDKRAGTLTETDEGSYVFQYDAEYLSEKNPPVSLTLPCREEPYTASVLHSFFDGLIPEGWLLELSVERWMLKRHDRFGLLLQLCHECLGACHVEPLESDEPELEVGP